MDIHHKEFGTVRMGGYNKEEVDAFLDMVADELDRLLHRNQEQAEMVESMRQKASQFDSMQQTLQNALINAQKSADSIVQEARAQAEAGAHYIDVNAGTFVGEEAQKLQWIVEAVQEVTELPPSIDSPDGAVIRAILPLVQQTPLINSLTLDPPRIQGTLPLVLANRPTADSPNAWL